MNSDENKTGTKSRWADIGRYWEHLNPRPKPEPTGWGLGHKYEALIHAEDMELFPHVKSKFDFTGEVVNIEWKEECFSFEFKVIVPTELYGVTFRDDLCACWCPDDGAIFERFNRLMSATELEWEPITDFAAVDLSRFIGRSFFGTLYPQEESQ